MSEAIKLSTEVESALEEQAHREGPSFSPMMNYQDTFIEQVGNHLVVAYISDDPDPMNPLEDWDGEGAIYTSDRHSRTKGEMQQALGLDSNWEPDLDLVDDFPDVFRDEWIEMASTEPEFQTWCRENGAFPSEAQREREGLKAFFAKQARHYWDTDDIDDFEFTFHAREKAFETLRDQGEIGEPDLVMLDVYEHSGVVYSISGSGPQCRWDTASGGACWVPDEDMKQEVDRRQAVYAFGRIEKSPFRTNKAPYRFVLDDAYGEVKSVGYKHWHEAFRAFQSFVEAQGYELPYRRKERETVLHRGRRRALHELCEGVLGTYNDFLAGRVYGFVALTYKYHGDYDSGDPILELIEEDSCWGVFGDDEAMEEARSVGQAEVERLKSKI